MYLSDIKRDDRFEGYLIVRSAEQRASANGKNYLDMTLADKSGSINAKMWDGTVQPPLAGSIVKVRATGNEFNGRMQLRVEKIRAVESRDAVDMSTLIPCAPRDPKEMLDEVVRAADHLGAKPVGRADDEHEPPAPLVADAADIAREVLARIRLAADAKRGDAVVRTDGGEDLLPLGAQRLLDIGVAAHDGALRKLDHVEFAKARQTLFVFRRGGREHRAVELSDADQRRAHHSESTPEESSAAANIATAIEIKSTAAPR